MNYRDPLAVDTVLVTRYQKTPDSRVIQHVYGPYTRSYAQSVKRMFESDFKYRPKWTRTPDAVFEVHVHKLLGENGRS